MGVKVLLAFKLHVTRHGKEQVIYDKLQKIHHAKVYYKKDIPERYHYKNNRRIMPILVVPEEGYSLQTNGSYVPDGNHGYDNSLPDMHPFFLAMGPAFKQGYSVDSFEMVDIYPMLCHILNLKPAPNNGSLEKVHELLKEKLPDNSTFLICK
ncbi:hypothetical protein KUTeg_007746 [Tegillarca granosa]|uniref:Uncharacterized protein n=1 Tax=Tegillarca granosa TaxID=220873 RepID=A0ABQ9FHF1_TEGGR|nr:hypothetical protein KUTeg_007746 [Tegillarca granosa]